ncbi:glycosyl hydrolases family 31-domain-containing protein [Obelidium mucronatum]|nr:glycosyl hydrolases family 31-domain-containing protein [Obelidium mucronatum]
MNSVKLLNLLALLLAATPTNVGAIPAGPVTSFERLPTNGQFRILTETTTTLLSILAGDTVRLQTVKRGDAFTEPGKPSIVIKTKWEDDVTSTVDETNDKEITVSWVNKKEGSNARYTVHIPKAPAALKVAITGTNGNAVYEESLPIDIGVNYTSQYLTHGGEEQFFGGGMQNGRFTHKFNTIKVERSDNWDDKGTPNSSPFYMSTKGYGIFRNTFSPGTYDFTTTKAPNGVVTTHAEPRFDAYIFLSPSLKGILDPFTQVTGRPFLPPMYGLELGDSDCYLHNANRGERRTLSYTTEIADGYVENDMPVGWLLVNDGYGCGYEDLPETAAMLASRNISMGLWTEFDLTNQPYEVQEGQVRVRKLDEKWIGEGYEFALSGCEIAYNGIEDYSDARGFVWTVEGWAGTQRCSVMWSGDQKGTWENIRVHIPTFQGAGLSAQAWTSGDIDGIWTGSAITYTRDLQHKAFAPVVMSMSGWAPFDKQPWRYGEPYTSINRKYLKLRQSLLPYFYSFAAEAYFKGIPPIRALVLEYPNDPVTWTTAVQYEFLFGTQFLVAPVYTEGAVVRNGIYLPEGTWFDYWRGGVRYHGNQVLNGFPAPLDTLPLFVKAGSIIPMWGNVNSFREVDKERDDLILDLYPASGAFEFDLYEDDMVTRKHRVGEYSYQKFTMTSSGDDKVEFDIGQVVGEYTGKPAIRGYKLKVHADLVFTQTVENTVDVKNVECNIVDAVISLEKDNVILVRIPRFATSESKHIVLSMRPRAVVGNNFVFQN